MRKKGKIASWNDEKGFGFIKPSDGGKDIFVHVKDLADRSPVPRLNQPVDYALGTDRQGRRCATKVTRLGDRLSRRRSSGLWARMTAGFFLAFLAISVLLEYLHPAILGLYVAASFLALFMYKMDKSAAQRGSRRTPEVNLHLVSLLGGWPGAMAAQQWLRHKTQKQSFRIVFWLTVILNCAVLPWFYTPVGTAAVQSLIAALT